MIADDRDVARTPKRPKKPAREYRSTARTAGDVTAALVAFGARVRELRLAADLSQEAAAERAGINPRHWQLIEAGRTNPTIATCFALARAVGASMSALFTNE